MYGTRASGSYVVADWALVTYKDPSQSNKARMVLTGSLITVYDADSKVRVRLRLW